MKQVKYFLRDVNFNKISGSKFFIFNNENIKNLQDHCINDFISYKPNCLTCQKVTISWA